MSILECHRKGPGTPSVSGLGHLVRVRELSGWLPLVLGLGLPEKASAVIRGQLPLVLGLGPSGRYHVLRLWSQLKPSLGLLSKRYRILRGQLLLVLGL